VPNNAASMRVLDLSDELAYQGARLLVGLGADVVRVRAQDEVVEPAQTLHWHAGKRVVDPGPAGREVIDRLAAQADVVLESGPVERLLGIATDDGGQPCSRWPDAVHVVVTPFGLTGPRRHWTADDLVLAAAGGMAWLGGRADGPPKPPPREQAVQLAGTHAALAALLGARALARDGHGQLVDISAQEATAATVETAAISWIHAGRYPSRNGGLYEHVAHRIFAAADGHVAGGYSGSDRMWTELLAWLVECGEAEDLTDPDLTDGVYRWQQRERVDATLARFIARRPAATFAEEARKRALPWAEVAGAADLRNNPQLRDRQFFVRVGSSGPDTGYEDVGFPFEAVRRPRPVRLDPQRAARADVWSNCGVRARSKAHPSSAPALSGLRVLDLTWVLAGPYATKILAEHGADVIKVESRHRQDPTRFSPSMRLSPHAGIDDGGYFLNFNRNKRSVAVNMRTARGQQLVRDLAARCDVVIDNFSAGVLARWGLSYEDLATRNPDIIQVSMAGTGQTGPWRDAVTFADTLAAMSGLSAETADPGGPPQGLTFGLGDMIAGNAAVLAILDRLQAGCGGYVDLSQFEAMTAVMGAAVLETQLGEPIRSATTGQPNRHPLRVPHGIYPTRGQDRWIAIAVLDEHAWRALCAVASTSPLAGMGSADLVERRRNEDRIDAVLAAWTVDQDGDALAEQLQRAGVAAAVVSTGRDLVEHDEHLAARGFYPELVHPLAGKVKHEGIVIRMQRTPGSLDRAAPLLGEHETEVLHGVLGLDEAFLEELRADGVLQ
jgi:crotonobetainyl-CoA:carnitine CoA-transferase CaiB-like acyl-CoA transferase